MAHSRRSLTLAFAFVAVAVAAFAADPAMPEQPRGVRVTAAWVTPPATKFELFASSAEGEAVPLNVGRGGRGREITLKRQGVPIRLLAKDPAPGAGKKESPTPGFLPVGQIAIPAGATDKYVLLLTLLTGSTQIQGLALADDTKAFPIGTVRMANFLSGPVLLKMGKQVKNVSPGLAEPFAYPVASQPDPKMSVAFPFAVAIENNVFYNGQLDAWAGSRTLAVVMRGASASSAPTVRFFVDQPQEPKPIR